jgi:geranylgeranyl diphosphate synthase type 3
MDDVEDSSDLRRGIPVAHKIYGVPQTINSANYVYFLAMQELYRFRAGRVGKANTGSSLNGKAEEVGNGEEMTEEDQEKELDEVITGAFPRISIHLKPGCE